jgi:hypothetical protein
VNSATSFKSVMVDFCISPRRVRCRTTGPSARSLYTPRSPSRWHSWSYTGYLKQFRTLMSEDVSLVCCPAVATSWPRWKSPRC